MSWSTNDVSDDLYDWDIRINLSWPNCEDACFKVCYLLILKMDMRDKNNNNTRGNPSIQWREPYARSRSWVVMQEEKTGTFSSDTWTNIPLYELPHVSFDQYWVIIQIFQAIFIDKKVRTQELMLENCSGLLPHLFQSDCYSKHCIRGELKCEGWIIAKIEIFASMEVSYNIFSSC